MSDPTKVIDQARLETEFPNVSSMLKCAREQKCGSEDEYVDTCQFLTLLKAYHREQVETVKAITQAAQMLMEKKTLYERVQEKQNPIDSL